MSTMLNYLLANGDRTAVYRIGIIPQVLLVQVRWFSKCKLDHIQSLSFILFCQNCGCRLDSRLKRSMFLFIVERKMLFLSLFLHGKYELSNKPYVFRINFLTSTANNIVPSSPPLKSLFYFENKDRFFNNQKYLLVVHNIWFIVNFRHLKIFHERSKKKRYFMQRVGLVLVWLSDSV